MTIQIGRRSLLEYLYSTYAAPTLSNRPALHSTFSRNHSVNEQDYAFYPDCRKKAIREKTIRVKLGEVRLCSARPHWKKMLSVQTVSADGKRKQAPNRLCMDEGMRHDFHQCAAMYICI